MRRRSRILWTGALAALAALQAGFVGVCTPAGNAPPPPPAASLEFMPASLSVHASDVVSIDVLVTTTRSLQAYDVAVQYDPGLLALTESRTWVDFDDDGSFFQSGVDAQAGQVHLVDLLHGTVSTQGQVYLANLTFLALAPGQATLQVDGEFAMPDGALVPVVMKKTASVRILR